MTMISLNSFNQQHCNEQTGDWQNFHALSAHRSAPSFTRSSPSDTKQHLPPMLTVQLCAHQLAICLMTQCYYRPIHLPVYMVAVDAANGADVTLATQQSLLTSPLTPAGHGFQLKGSAHCSCGSRAHSPESTSRSPVASASQTAQQSEGLESSGRET